MMTGNSINMNGPSIVIDQQIRAGRTYILERIRDQRDILFGRFTDSLKKVDKERAWNQIALDAQMLGYFPNNRNGGYLRDTTWQNWRKRFVEKREKKLDYERTGGVGGAKKIDFDEADLLIADILGGGGRGNPSSRSRRLSDQQNAHINGTLSSSDSDNYLQNYLEIDIKEETDDPNYSESQDDYDEEEEIGDTQSKGFEPESASECHVNDTFVRRGSSPLDVLLTTHAQADSAEETESRIVQIDRNNGAFNKSNHKRRKVSSGTELRTDANVTVNTVITRPSSTKESLQDKKLHLEVDLLEIECYKRKLEVLQLERHLGLSPSKITKELLAKTDSINQKSTHDF